MSQSYTLHEIAFLYGRGVHMRTQGRPDIYYKIEIISQTYVMLKQYRVGNTQCCGQCITHFCNQPQRLWSVYTP